MATTEPSPFRTPSKRYSAPIAHGEFNVLADPDDDSCRFYLSPSRSSIGATTTVRATPLSAAPKTPAKTPNRLTRRLSTLDHAKEVQRETVLQLSELADHYRRAQRPVVLVPAYMWMIYAAICIVLLVLLYGYRPYCSSSGSWLSRKLPCVQCPSDAICGHLSVKSCTAGKIVFERSVWMQLQFV